MPKHNRRFPLLRKGEGGKRNERSHLFLARGKKKGNSVRGKRRSPALQLLQGREKGEEREKERRA